MLKTCLILVLIQFSQSQNQFISDIDSYFKSITKPNEPGIAVLVMKNEKHIFKTQILKFNEQVEK